MNKLLTKSLYIVSTPIGNLSDITLRALDVLKNSDIVLCEDTRHSLKLLNYFKIKKKLISYHKFNEKKQVNTLIEYINQGKNLSLISDAGTPLLSDPGRHLVNECLKNNINIIPIPGVSSITAAMSISGFSEQFLFYGFLPKKQNELNKVFESLKEIRFSLVFFIPAIKINFYIKNIREYFSGRKLLIAKEISKIHEAFYREEIDNLELFKTPLKGELTLVISESNPKKTTLNEKKIINIARKYLKNLSLKDTVNLIFEKEKVNKKLIYKICLKIKNEKNT
tara:strand:- start:1928 stop:2770 length:843 start_codon:yes stop_codon:yes gene_type:complete